MATRYEHSGNAVPTKIVGDISATATSITIEDSTGWPTGATGPFWVTLRAGTASEEKALVTSRTGATLTLASASDRGKDSTTATTHPSGASIIHSFSATEADDANRVAVEVDAVAGDLVGTTATQTLTGKTLSAASNVVAHTVANAAARTALTPYLGMRVIEADTARTYIYNGTAWVLAGAPTDGGAFTPQGSTAGTWTTSSQTGIWRQAAGIVQAWAVMTHSSGGSTSGQPLLVYANGLPAFAADLTHMAVGEYSMNGYGAGPLSAGASLAAGFTAKTSTGDPFQPTFSAGAVVGFHITYPAAI